MGLFESVGRLSSSKVWGSKISLCCEGFLEVLKLAWSRHVHPCVLEQHFAEGPLQVPGVAREAQLITWGLIKDVLSV